MDFPLTPSMLPHVMDVFDRMDAAQLQRVESGEMAFQQALTQAVIQTCERQGQIADHQTIARAIEDHVVQGSLVPTSPGRPSSLTFGWKRPTSRAALDHERGRLKSMWCNAIVWLTQTPERKDIMASGAGALGGTAILIVGLMPPGGWIMATVATLMAGALTLAGIIGAGAVIQERRKSLTTVVPPDAVIDAWLTWPETRGYLQRCLTSALPVILQGDSTRLGQIQVAAETSQADAASRQQNQDAADQEAQRMALVRSKVLSTLPSPTSAGTPGPGCPETYPATERGILRT